MSDYPFLQRIFLYLPKWCTYSTIWLLRGWFHVKLLLSPQMFCVHHTAMHHFTVSLHLKPHTWMHVCLVVACHLRLWENEWGFQHATAVTQLWTGHQNKSAQKVDHGEKHSATPAGTWTCDLLIMSPAPYHWAIPTPHDNHIHGMF